ncbi:substrate-binding periplasmic protein [Vogesella indigofera]|uniref:substrate-binding periplasmic protein n=1 Tax=Vogesella indigofera TaxID=45465 RepID=UPI00234EB5B4|nr:transporter substrate-binding domain-containing protein [Vogesella indigofera]MDC7708378.1 transporter substrate-binding domain-containing protein [Vogesella indigofera]
MRWPSIKAGALLLGLLLGGGSASAARAVYVGFPESIPPWVQAGGRTGIAIELLRSALQAEGLHLHSVQQPYARRLQAYRRGQLDALYDISPQQQQYEQLNGSISQPLHSFDNVAVALGRRQLEIEQLGDLARWRVMAWDGAGNSLPAGYDRLLALADGNYLEAGNQGHQLLNLLAGRVDVILSDRLIFEWQRRQLYPAAQDHTPPLRIYPLLPPKEAGILFRDSGLRARVDARIRALKACPQYQAIFARYGSEAQP